MTRKRMMRFKALGVTAALAGLIGLTGCTLPGAVKLDADHTYPLTSGKTLKLMVTTDTHYLPKSLNDQGVAFQKFIANGDGKELVYSEELMDALIADARTEKPDIVIISGDLTSNGEKAGHLGLARKLAELEQTGAAVYVVPGNHDIANPWARKFQDEQQLLTDPVSAKEFKELYRPFGYDEAIARDKSSLSYLAAPSPDLWLLMLDSNLYSNNRKLGHPQTDGQLSDATLKWVKKCTDLAAKRGARMITVMHHNLLDHSEVVREGFTLNNNWQVLEQFRTAGLTLNLSGHVHIQHISDNRKGSQPMVDIATNALSVYPHQYGVMDYTPSNHRLIYNTQKLDVEGWARSTGAEDANLLGFEAYSAKLFGDRSYMMGYNNLVKGSAFQNYSEEDIEAMAEVMRVVNANYFAGKQSELKQLLRDSKGYRLWQDAPAGFLKTYIDTMMKHEEENNHLELELMPLNP